VSLHGLLGRQALLIVDGKPPRKPWRRRQTHLGVTVLSTDEDRAVLALAGGQRLTLRVGRIAGQRGWRARARRQRPGGTVGGCAAATSLPPAASTTGRRSFWWTPGRRWSPSARPRRTGMGLNYRTGQPVTLRTANGTAPGWRAEAGHRAHRRRDGL
jgi:aspartyl protease family protein